MRQKSGTAFILATLVISLSVVMAPSAPAAGAAPAALCEKNPGHHRCVAPLVSITTTTTTAPTTTTTAGTSTTTTTVATTTTTTTVPKTVAPYGSCSGTLVTPSTNLQDAINAGGNNHVFCFADGTYTFPTTLRPKAGQKFIAINRRQAILSGAGGAEMAFNGDGAPGVEVRGLIIERFQTPLVAGYGALKGSSGWLIVDNAIRHNAVLGVYHGAGSQVLNNSIHHNGKTGIGGFKAHNSLIEGNEVYENGHGSFSDRGGSKWTGGINLTIRNNDFHHNYNNAIWLDGDNLDVVIENNRSVDNYGKGIQYEISCAGVIRGNTIERNALVGLLIVASNNVDAHGNVIRDNGQNIEVWHQNRGSGANCAWKLDNVRVFDNTIRTTMGHVGIRKHNVSDGDAIFSPTDSRVRFDRNTYRFGSVTKPFHFANSLRSVAEWRAYGQDPNSDFGTTSGVVIN